MPYGITGPQWVEYDICSRRHGYSISDIHTLPWRHNGHDGVSNHQPHGCLLNRLFRRRPKKTSKLRVTGLCVGNSPVPVDSPHTGPVTQKNVSIWWRHHEHRIISPIWQNCHEMIHSLLLPNDRKHQNVYVSYQFFSNIQQLVKIELKWRLDLIYNFNVIRKCPGSWRR